MVLEVGSEELVEGPLEDSSKTSRQVLVCFCMVAWLVGPQCEGATLKELASWRLFSWIRHWDWIHVENWENKLDWMFSWEKKSVETGSK